MKRDEISNMLAGREMDALVAEKVMGWRRQGEGWNVITPFVRRTPESEDAEEARLQIIWLKENAEFMRFSTDIAAAWEVVNEMQTRNYWVYMGMLSSYSYAIFTKDRTPLEYRAEAKANEISLAICRAALLAVIEKD